VTFFKDNNDGVSNAVSKRKSNSRVAHQNGADKTLIGFQHWPIGPKSPGIEFSGAGTKKAGIGMEAISALLR
jgi:hypothetical protein